jgi:hypothetical protein
VIPTINEPLLTESQRESKPLDKRFRNAGTHRNLLPEPLNSNSSAALPQQSLERKPSYNAASVSSRETQNKTSANELQSNTHIGTGAGAGVRDRIENSRITSNSSAVISNQNTKNITRAAVKQVVNPIITSAVNKNTKQQEQEKLELQKQSNKRRKNALNASKSMISEIISAVGKKLSAQSESKIQTSNSKAAAEAKTAETSAHVENWTPNWSQFQQEHPVLNAKAKAAAEVAETNNYDVNLNTNLNKIFTNPKIIGKIHDKYSSWLNTLPKNREYSNKEKSILKSILVKYKNFSQKYPIREYTNYLTPLNINSLPPNNFNIKYGSNAEINHTPVNNNQKFEVKTTNTVISNKSSQGILNKVKNSLSWFKKKFTDSSLEEDTIFTNLN